MLIHRLSLYFMDTTRVLQYRDELRWILDLSQVFFTIYHSHRIHFLFWKTSNVSRVICVIVKHWIWCYSQILSCIKIKIKSTYLLHLIRNKRNHCIFNAKLFNNILKYFCNLSWRGIFSSLFFYMHVSFE